jgi:LPXTG-site transpeptidase (sortase) family protein
VKFNQDVYNPVGDSDPEDVTNPNNYMLIRDLGDTAGFQTKSCSLGADSKDTSFAIGTVTYDSATTTATFTVNGGLSISNGTYQLFICGSTSIVDPLDNTLKLVGSSGPGSDFIRNFTINVSGGGGGGTGNSGNGNSGSTTRVLPSAAVIPVTGFAPDHVTLLPIQPADKAYKPLDKIRIEIPTLGVDFPIVGVSLSGNNWDLTWLKENVGYLEGSAYPTFNGNTVLTAHVIDSNNNLGPFSDIKGMHINDKIFIHAYGKTYVYEVQENQKILPSNISVVFKHEEYSWVTLVTCEDYDAKAKVYKYRRMVRAVLVSVVEE